MEGRGCGGEVVKKKIGDPRRKIFLGKGKGIENVLYIPLPLTRDPPVEFLRGERQRGAERGGKEKEERGGGGGGDGLEEWRGEWVVWGDILVWFGFYFVYIFFWSFLFSLFSIMTNPLSLPPIANHPSPSPRRVSCPQPFQHKKTPSRNIEERTLSLCFNL